jgi:hypothetical protein
MLASGKWGKMLLNFQRAGIPTDGMTLVGMGRRPRVRSQFDSVRAGIGVALRSLHSDVLREPLPDRIAELLRQLDEQLRQLDQNTDKT